MSVTLNKKHYLIIYSYYYRILKYGCEVTILTCAVLRRF